MFCSNIAQLTHIQTTGRSLLLPFLPSIRELELELPDHFQLKNHGYLQKDPLELLEAVRISMRCRDELNVMTEHFSFAHVPRLCSLALDVLWSSDPLEPQFLQMPWTQLTRLVLSRDVPLEAWHTIVRWHQPNHALGTEFSMPELARRTLLHGHFTDVESFIFARRIEPPLTDYDSNNLIIPSVGDLRTRVCAISMHRNYNYTRTHVFKAAAALDVTVNSTNNGNGGGGGIGGSGGGSKNIVGTAECPTFP
ncbi:hypothetical protein Hypma_004909 [Hypsizygus marmoreus]|uniref:Uncharacterized protein n=1 Tax=Hypsizygus marmoreus TaxID=39966 RepID=A0A369KGM9_HYPMA|nr:hypothetical protein Hypma_004909 [Hypsizygus marmoreus]